jgi:hypothetical protein
MSEINTGGPAFPFNAADHGFEPSAGITKLEYFTGQALAGMIAGYAVSYGSPTNAPMEIAEEAVSIAECVLAALAAREVAK